MTKIIILFVISLAVGLRFYQLGSNPPSLDWDEASLGYNAYSILKTGADEYGNKFPLSIRSFDDYKPPSYVYLTVPSIAVFGLNEFAVRLPAAIFGIFSVVVTYHLSKELFSKWDRRLQGSIALISALFLAISPWHLQFSRAAFEGNVGLFFLLLGVLLFFKGLKKPVFFILSSLFFALSLYSYHSFRLVNPLILIVLVIFFFKELSKAKIFVIASAVLLIVLSIPIYENFIHPQGTGARLSMVAIFSEADLAQKIALQLVYDKSHNDSISVFFHNRRFIYAGVISRGYLDHFGIDFLFFHGDGGVQHHAVNMGMLYLWDLPFILAGVYFIIRKLNKRLGVLLAIFLFAPLPAAITTGTPHPVRAIAMIPAFQIFSAAGLVLIIDYLIRQKKNILGIGITLVIIVALCINIIYYLKQYYIFTPIQYGYFWQYGNKEVVEYAKRHESEYKKIIITYRYDQPYIYYLFYNKIDPSWYQKNWDYNSNGQLDRFKRVIGKYEFRNIDWSLDQKLPNTLFIASPKEIPESTTGLIKEVKFLDGKTAFRIVGT